jgi:hypothetical protein
MAISLPTAQSQAGMGGMAIAGGQSFAVAGQIDANNPIQVDLETKRVRNIGCVFSMTIYNLFRKRRGVA